MFLNKNQKKRKEKSPIIVLYVTNKKTNTNVIARF
jgi:hypothetical protein